MIQCDECYLVVTKVAYCSDACKQKAYRKKVIAVEDHPIKGPTPIKKPKDLKKDTVKVIKPCRHGLTYCRECL